MQFRKMFEPLTERKKQVVVGLGSKPKAVSLWGAVPGWNLPLEIFSGSCCFHHFKFP